MCFAKCFALGRALASATAAMLVMLPGCGSPTAARDSTSVTRIEVTTTTAASQPTALAGHRGDHIPDPLINGGYSYQGYGRFQLLAGAAGSETSPGGGGGGGSFSIGPVLLTAARRPYTTGGMPARARFSSRSRASTSSGSSGYSHP